MFGNVLVLVLTTLPYCVTSGFSDSKLPHLFRSKSKKLASINMGDKFRRLRKIVTHQCFSFLFIFPLQNWTGGVTNVTSVFYLRGKGAEGQVTELLKCLILSCRAARVKTSYTCYCLLHNSIAYFWLWHYHDRWEEEAGLTGVHLELIHHPVNHKPFVPQNVWLQFLPKLTDREAW